MPRTRSRNKPARRLRTPAPNPASHLVLVPSQDNPWPGEAEGAHVDLSDLTFRQQSALPVIAASSSLSQAARNAGIDETTLRRWLREPVFAERLAAFRQQSAVIAREELNVIARRGMAVLAEAMSDPDSAIRVRAARYALSYTVQFAEIQNLTASIEEMQRMLSNANLQENARK